MVGDKGRSGDGERHESGTVEEEGSEGGLVSGYTLICKPDSSSPSAIK